MPATLKGQWHGLRRSPPRRRFQDHYASAQQERARSPAWRRALRIGVAFAMMLTGLIFVFIPGPAILFFAVASALFAAEWLGFARGLDWIELRFRVILNWAKRHWRTSGIVARIAVIGFFLAGAAGAVFAAW